MPGRATRDLAILKRRDQVADLYLQGATQAKIAEQLGVGQPTISNDLKRVREAWRESSVRDFDELRTLEMLKIERIEQEAWAGWNRSQQPQQTATVRGEGGPGQKASKTMRTASATRGSWMCCSAVVRNAGN